MRVVRSLRAVFAVMLAVGAAVAGEPASPKTPRPGDLLGSCAVATMSCTDYEKAVGAGAKEACLKYKLTWSDEACPTAGVVGTCVKKEGGGRGYTHSYPPGTAATAKKACDNTPGGAFVP